MQGDFAPDQSHAVSVSYQNAANSLLVVDTAAINGATIAGGNVVLSNNGSLGFSFTTPDAPAPTVLGYGPDTLALTVSQAYLRGNAAFTISVDGNQVGGVQTAASIQGNGQSQAFDVLGDFSGAHGVSVDFLNPASDAAGAQRALFVGGATIDGTAIANSAVTLTTAGSQSFAFNNVPAVS